jgi:ethanolamine utilization protein EutA
MRTVRLIGLDFGTTTSSCVVASASLMHNAVSGRKELTGIREEFRSELVFTPFKDGRLDEERLQQHVDEWLTAGDVTPQGIFGGGALLTGLAARQENASRLMELIRSKLGDALIATADDPCLEAWLAFQASASALSRSQPDRWVINLDIGGGTTNLAAGKNGEVMATGSLFVGARHVQFVPGTYRIVSVSTFARRLFEHLGITSGPGNTLSEMQVAAILDFYIDLLESALSGDSRIFENPVPRLHREVAFRLPPDVRDPIVTISGGVAELVYERCRGKPLPSTTFFGDLGIDLAERLINSPRWAAHFNQAQPQCLGRATVYGLLLHATQISGSTLFLPDPTILPLGNIPILGSVTGNSTADQIRDILHLVVRSPLGGCVRVVPGERSAAAIASAGERIAAALLEIDFPCERPLVLLVDENCGKALGQYVSRWGSIPLKLVVLDEIEVRDARFVQIGSLRDQVVPVSFYGMN